MIDVLLNYPIISSLVALGGLSIFFGAVLGFAAVKFKVEGVPAAVLMQKPSSMAMSSTSALPAARQQ